MWDPEAPKPLRLYGLAADDVWVNPAASTAAAPFRVGCGGGDAAATLTLGPRVRVPLRRNGRGGSSTHRTATTPRAAVAVAATRAHDSVSVADSTRLDNFSVADLALWTGAHGTGGGGGGEDMTLFDGHDFDEHEGEEGDDEALVGEAMRIQSNMVETAYMSFAIMHEAMDEVHDDYGNVAAGGDPLAAARAVGGAGGGGGADFQYDVEMAAQEELLAADLAGSFVSHDCDVRPWGEVA